MIERALSLESKDASPGFTAYNSVLLGKPFTFLYTLSCCKALLSLEPSRLAFEDFLKNYIFLINLDVKTDLLVSACYSEVYKDR